MAALLTVVAFAAGAPPAAGQTAPVTVEDISAPATVPAGAAVRIGVDTERASACELRLSPATAATGSSTINLGSDASIVWRWRVPEASGSGTARAEVRCWRTQSDAGVLIPDAQSTVPIKVTGRDRGPVRAVEAGTLSVALESDGVDLESLANVAQAVAAGIALLTLFVIARQLVATRAEARVARTTHLFERYNHREFMRTWSQILCVIQVEDEGECVDCIRRLEAVPTGNGALHAADLDLPPRTPAEKAEHALRRLQRPGEKEQVALNDILAFTSFFEEAALLFNEKTLDRPLLVRSFGVAMTQAFSQCWWWMSYERRGAVVAVRAKELRDHETEDYADWERAVAAIVGQQWPPRKGERPQGSDAKVRALCLPAAEGDDASPDEWRDCGRLSRAVGDLLRHDEGRDRLEALVTRRAGSPSLAPPARREPTPRTLCLPPWTEAMPRPSWWRRAVGRLGAWLDGRGIKWLRDLGLWMTGADSRISVREKYQQLGGLLDACRQKAGPSGLDGLIADIQAEAKR